MRIFDDYSENPTKILGARGEALAAEFLRRQGFLLTAANFAAPVGRNRRGVLVETEVDLIAYDAETLVFIEVKTRRAADFAAPETAVNLRKQRQITRAARVYRQTFGLGGQPFRYDVVSVVLPDDNAKPQIELFKNFWTESKFRKAQWTR